MQINLLKKIRYSENQSTFQTNQKIKKIFIKSIFRAKNGLVYLKEKFFFIKVFFL
jgi:hypothetical protein